MSWRLTFLAAVAIVSIAGVALAAKGGDSNGITLCAAKGSGDVHLASGKHKCSKGERKLTIAKRGPAGPPGDPGQPGEDGTDGTPADLAPEAVHPVAEPPVSDCDLNPGVFCAGNGPHWDNADGYTPVGYFKDASGLVHLQGTAQEHGAGGAPDGIFYLPAGYRPPDVERFGASDGCATADVTAVVIDADGLVHSDGNCVSLDGIIFRP